MLNKLDSKCWILFVVFSCFVSLPEVLLYASFYFYFFCCLFGSCFREFTWKDEAGAWNGVGLVILLNFSIKRIMVFFFSFTLFLLISARSRLLTDWVCGDYP